MWSAPLLAEVQVSKRLFAVMHATGGEGLSFEEWACTVPDKCLVAIEHGEAQCTGPVWSLCDAINAVPDMKALICSAEECVGSWAVDALKAANDLATKCVPELLNKMVGKLGGLLLSSQEWFQEKCGQELFLPKEAPDSFWDKCANHPLPLELKQSAPCLTSFRKSIVQKPSSVCAKSSLCVWPAFARPVSKQCKFHGGRIRFFFEHTSTWSLQFGHADSVVQADGHRAIHIYIHIMSIYIYII